MAEPRLKTGLWVQAQLRTLDIALIPAFVLHRGDADAGAVLVKLNRMDKGCQVLARVLDGEGERVWLAVAGGPAEDRGTALDQERACDAFIARERNIDPDVWVIEVEDLAGRYHPQSGVAEDLR